MHEVTRGSVLAGILEPLGGMGVQGSRLAGDVFIQDAEFYCPMDK